ncbi:hypothetical protein K435DRAFT_898938, partial [Dendrothele bispora CBS 962.96]
RLSELLNPSGVSGSVALYDPFEQSRGQSSVENVPQDLDIIMQPLAGKPFEDLPINLSIVLVHDSLPHIRKLGFFLSIDKFTRSIQVSDYSNLQEGLRPIQPLLNTIYLWGAHFSSSPAYSPDQMSFFLNRAIQSVSSSLSTPGNRDHPQAVIQTIQASVLLANYLFCHGRLLEGRYHVASASSLILSFGLNKLGGH